MSQDDRRGAEQGAVGTRRKRGADGGSSELITSGGNTRIADDVVAKIATMAARQVGGVYEMGAGLSRTMGAVRDRLPGVAPDGAQGVAVQVGERQAAVDIDLVVEYGLSIPDLATAVRTNVVNEIEHMCGLEVVEVNITVDDVHMPEEESPEPRAEESRVR
ncbi:Asp23/Gls24 family envelope stress response protein [Actinomadura sp. WMMA1423]|uniref:Asp23/Gls24 family envelope stress response protein n=1 Tax=Actinomadura sp. WMMA1423 TaxID=2591108 RepID=UPI001F0D0DE8|nr:Asp23/Gls24 family envelope stress response protein [Actinomadura sp. WMMA1423]